MERCLRYFLTGLMLGVLAISAEAQGRRPSSDDAFPDYNRLEFHPALPDVSVQYPSPAASLAAPPLTAGTTPLQPPGEMTASPPPKAVPIPEQASEPPMPDEIVNTLSAAVTNQAVVPPDQK